MRAVKGGKREPQFAEPRRPRRKAASSPARSARPFAALGLKPSRPFGRRKRGAFDRFWNVIAFVRSHRVRVLSFSALVGLVVIGLVGYGLWSNGTFSRWGDIAVVAFYDATADAGLKVESVTLTGRKRIAAGDVFSALSVARGAPILAFDADAARERLLGLEWVKDARVSRRMPDAIIVSLVEKQPFAIWQMKGQMQLIERDGGVITQSGLEAFSDLPMVVGAGANLKASDLIDRLKQHPRIARALRAAVLVSERRWDLHMKNDVTVMLPEANLTAGFVRLDRLILEQDILRRAVTIIDLRLNDRMRLVPLDPTTPLSGNST